jgi:ubiquinone/menaquinone biosynthesis C-methylase UbiE
MELQVATDLIKQCVPPHNHHWWDLGAGSGLFTRALAGLLTEGTIVAMDRDVNAMEPLTAHMGKVEIIKHEIDFTKMNFPGVNPSGILMANSIHFVRDKIPFLKALKSRLTKNGVLVIVEYEMTASNPWVPYPVAYVSLAKLGTDAGFASVKKISTAPSKYQENGIYSARLE